MSDTRDGEITYTVDSVSPLTLRFRGIILSDNEDRKSITFVLNNKAYRCDTVESIDDLIKLMKKSMKKYKFWKLAAHAMFVILIMIMIYPLIEILQPLIK